MYTIVDIEYLNVWFNWQWLKVGKKLLHLLVWLYTVTIYVGVISIYIYMTK